MSTRERGGGADEPLLAVLREAPESWTPDCVEPERMIAVAERALPEAESTRLLAHVAFCGRCRREYAETIDLLQLSSEVLASEAAPAGREAAAASTAAPREVETRRPVPFWQRLFPPMPGLALGAAAACAVVAVVYAASVQVQRNRLAASVRYQTGLLVQEETSRRALEQQLAAAQHQSVGQASEVNDLRSRLKAQGTRMAMLERDAAALAQAPLPVPEWMLRAEGGRVRGAEGPGETAQLRLVKPVDSAVWDPRPVLEVEPAAGASDYRVTLEPAGSTVEVPAPKQLSPGRWQPAVALPGGQAYQWAVTAQRKGAPVRSVTAKFYVLSDAERRQVEAARKQYAENPLALGIVYARVGLTDEAEAQLAKAAKAVPPSPAAVRWLAEIRKHGGQRL